MAAIVPEELRGANLTQDAARIAPGSGVNSRWLLYAVQSHVIWSQLEAGVLGATVKGINIRDLKRPMVPVPPPHIQQRIADFLDRKTAAIDTLIAKKECLIDLLQEKRQAVVTRAVTKGLDPTVPMKESGVAWIGVLPKHWSVTPLRGLLRHRGEHNSRLQTTNVLSVVKDVGVIPYAERTASGNKHSEDISKYKVIHPGDLVMNRMNIIIGSVGVSRYYGASSIEYYVLRPASPGISTEFFGHVFACRGFQNSLVGVGSGILAHRMRISTEEMNKLPLPLPPRREQDAICTWIGKQTRRESELSANLSRAVDLLREYRRALITAAVTGKIDVSKEAA
jgi:type I restriction enzyme S subunit